MFFKIRSFLTKSLQKIVFNQRVKNYDHKFYFNMEKKSMMMMILLSADLTENCPAKKASSCLARLAIQTRECSTLTKIVFSNRV
jgi:hypothetical protein